MADIKLHKVTSNVRPIAFYLPQYHPIPENDKWWGKGFTEWTNVVKARPLFRGHYQPHLPADLGFYDLRVPEIRQAQADLAREVDIYGFCYYHYWFEGRRVLERPFNEVLASGKPQFPFCLCWANENWTRRWDGKDTEVLLEQTYSEEDDRRHGRWLVNAFRDDRYIRVEDKPIFLVYKASSIPNPIKTATIWREEASKAGIGEIMLCSVESHLVRHHVNPQALGFDAVVEFQPNTHIFATPLQRVAWRMSRTFGLQNRSIRYDYGTMVEKVLQKRVPDYPYFRCVFPSWDNTARRKVGAVIFEGSTPDLYEKWLRMTIDGCKPNRSGETYIFINAWNEWAEGCHLEPCERWSHAYLDATQRAMRGSFVR
ncbi:MAG: glycoside hydrolase family 99-like domain-containing protein [Herpetosiphonaceae bacterium]|nr:glycoside hydrolase family 99-like domain-containing protein [Herpetosiphonaceae bacterium]